MKIAHHNLRNLIKGIAIVSLLTSSVLSQASDSDTIGLTVLRQIDPTLTGAGVRVAQTEAPLTSGDFEVNPSALGQPASLFNWISSNGVAATFPNAVGTESSHADGVAANFYGASTGVAPGIAHIDNYEANYFINNEILAISQPAIGVSVVNQSFVFGNQNSPVDQSYDNYAVRYNALFISAIGNGGAAQSPGTSYNGIGVGAYGGSSSIGVTNGGRCKPDITAPASVTSFSTPYVSGSAAVLLQAAIRGDGGTNITAGTNLCTIKALLLNGAVKPADWTNGVGKPLDARYGAGIVNVFNSWKQLSGGKRPWIEVTSNSPGAGHPPGTSSNNLASNVGWDFSNITNSVNKERVHHYYLNVGKSGGNTYTATATLVWNRGTDKPSATDLNLYLYDTSNSNLVASSVSTVDNVEHIFVPSLPAGRYDLQVWKTNSSVSSAETYALAYEFFNLSLSVTRTNNNVVISWPVAPTGFNLQTTSDLTPPASWSNVNAAVIITNNQNTVPLPIGSGDQFFRLQRP